MTDQPALFDDRPDWQTDDIGRRWLAHHEEHPWIGDTLKRLAVEWQQKAPHSRCGMKMLWERLRWEILTSEDLARLGAVPALDNRYTSRYARWLMLDPRFADLFELRALRSAA